MKIQIEGTSTIIAHQVSIANDPLSRMKGLLGKESLEPGSALVITACNSIHMFFMKFPLDVVFINQSGTIVGMVERIPPFGLSPIFWKAVSAVELPAGSIALYGIQEKQRLIITND